MINIPSYIDEDILIEKETVIKVKQLRVLGNSEGDRRTIIFQYPDSNSEHVLYSADPNCEHEIEAQYSGIKCIKCGGWYCA